MMKDKQKELDGSSSDEDEPEEDEEPENWVYWFAEEGYQEEDFETEAAKLAEESK